MQISLKQSFLFLFLYHILYLYFIFIFIILLSLMIYFQLLTFLTFIQSKLYIFLINFIKNYFFLNKNLLINLFVLFLQSKILHLPIIISYNIITYFSMGVFYISFNLLFKIFSVLSFTVFLIIVLSHIYSRFKRGKKLKLNSDSIVLIVGACTGIGKVMAVQIARQYYSTILLVDRRKQLFQQVSKQIKKQNGICQCYLCDLSDLKAVDHLVETIKEQWKKIDFLIYNAGIQIPNLAWQTKQEQLHAIMNVNFFSPVKVIKGLLSRLEKGHIAVVASVLSITEGIAEQSAYISSKHAIFGYLNSLRQQFIIHRRNITLSIGCPYAINTKLFEGYKSKLDKIFPILDENYVGQRLVKEFVDKKQVCFIGRRHSFLAKFMLFLPTYVTDWLLITINQSDFSKHKKTN